MVAQSYSEAISMRAPCDALRPPVLVSTSRRQAQHQHGKTSCDDRVYDSTGHLKTAEVMASRTTHRQHGGLASPHTTHRAVRIELNQNRPNCTTQLQQYIDIELTWIRRCPTQTRPRGTAHAKQRTRSSYCGTHAVTCTAASCSLQSLEQ